MQINGMLARLDNMEGNWESPLKGIVENLDIALKEGRSLISFLENETPLAKSDLPQKLEEFVSSLLHEAKQNGQRIELMSVAGEWPALPDYANWNLLRIVQQAVRNAIQHAGPCVIQIRLEVTQDPVRLIVEVADNGRGFEPDGQNRNRQHFGMASMRHRAKLIGANLGITSALGTGCRVVCTVPLPIANMG
jgi:signal transduction histidine kinase